MKNQKMTIIAVVTGCVAVFAVLLLVLFLTGVFTTGGSTTEAPESDALPSVATTEPTETTEAAEITEKPETTESTEPPTTEMTVYDYLESIGNFRMNTAVGQDTEDIDYTWYFWTSDDGSVEVVKSVSDYTTSAVDSVFFMYYSQTYEATTCISHPDFNDEPAELMAYAEIEKWCIDNDLTLDDVMDAVDQYSESVK